MNRKPLLCATGLLFIIWALILVFTSDLPEAEHSPTVVEHLPRESQAAVEMAADRTSGEDVQTLEKESSSESAAIPAFREWAKGYLAAPEDRRQGLLSVGRKLAIAHTREIAALISVDPERAISEAVPMVIRQDLPESIVSLLENRVRVRAALEVYGNVPLPEIAAKPDFTPYTRTVTAKDGKSWNAHVFGTQESRRTISTASINGISVGGEMAVADSPVRPLETGERPDVAGREVVEFCPVSGKETDVSRTPDGELPEITEDTPAIETPERIIYVCNGGHIQEVAASIREEEERLHWESLGVYLNAGAGSGAGTSPIGTIPGGWTLGQRKFLYIRATFPDQLDDPQSDAECHDSLRQMADYVTETSYGRCYFTYTVAPLIVLPYPESWYVQYQADGSSADTLIQSQSRTIARSLGYDYLAYDLDAVRWSGTVGSYGGSASVGARGMRLKTSSVSTLCHELGHNLGVWHANFWRTSPPSFIGPGTNQEYGNNFDVMGSSSGQFTAAFKNTLNWLPVETFWTVKQSGTFRIHQFDAGSSDPAQRHALRITKDAERDYWAEFRLKHTTNPGFSNGLMMTWDGWGLGGIGGSGGSPPNGSNRGAQLLDMTPGSFGNGITDTRNDSALWVGRTFSDEDSEIRITPISKNTGTTPPSMDVFVSLGPQPGNLPPTLSIVASNTTVATNASITVTATAIDPNGDPLAFAWVFDDGSYSTDNSPVQSKSWTTAGHYQVLCTASDMKGKRTTRSVLITVGSPSKFTVSGNITGPDSLPLEGIYVANRAPSGLTTHPDSGIFRGTWTDSDGNYTLTGLASGSQTVTPTLYPNVFSPSGFSNPVTVGPSTTGKNFTAALLPSITITATDPAAREGSSPDTGTLRIARTGSTAAALEVQVYNATTGTAKRNTDYTLSPALTAATNDGGNGTSKYTIPAGSAFLDITVTPSNDSTAEGTEYAVLDLSNTSSGYVITGPATGIVEIADDDSPNLPVVKLTPLDNVASEDGLDAATLKLERNGPLAGNLTVNFTFTGTATRPADYAFPTSAVIPAGSASTTVTLTPVDDSEQEETETVIVTLATNAAYAKDTISSAQTITLHDNDFSGVTVTATDSTASETPVNTGTFTVTRSAGDPTLPLTVDYALAGRAIHGVDYRRLDGRAIIPAGARSTTVVIDPFDDLLDEGTQDVILRLRSTTSYRIDGSGFATVTITDNDAPQVYVRLSTTGGTEPASGSSTAVAFKVNRPSTGTAITVNYAISGTASSGLDFTALPGTIAFASGDTSKAINISALADAEIEDAESVTMTLLPGTGYTLMTGQDSSTTGFILDGDQPTINVSAADTSTTLTTQGSETSASLRFIISRAVSTSSALVVNYTMGGTAIEGVDYTGTTGSVTIPSGSKSAYVTLVPVNDTIPEGVETIVMEITPQPGTYGLATSSATIHLADNDAFASGSVAFSAATGSVQENAGSYNLQVKITGSPPGTVSVNYRVSAGTATGGYDFLLNPGTLVFPPGTTTLNIPVIIYQDVIPEPAETVAIQLYNVTGANLGTSTHTLTINNLSLPEAFTDEPSNFVTNGATLNGRVIPNGLATTTWFEYGPTTAYGTSTPVQSPGSGTSSVSVSAAVTGIPPGVYHYRSVATNSAGTSYGIDQLVYPDNAELVGLSLDTGSLSPSFSATQSSYLSTAAGASSSVIVTPVRAHPDSTVKVNGSLVSPGASSAPVTLSVGTTVITTVVTARDGSSTKTYTVSITREQTPLEVWQSTYLGGPANPIAALDQDPDFDGIPNLLEFFLGGLPSGTGSSNTAILPTHVLTGSSFIFTFQRKKSADLMFSTIVESSSSLEQGMWSEVAEENILSEEFDTLTDSVTATIPLPPDGGSLFVRLKVRPKP